MRVAKLISGTLIAATLALGLLLQAAPATAAGAFDSTYFGESAFLTVNPGQTGQFAVGFTNRGSVGWQRQSSTQVNLAQCCPLNSASPNAGWNDGTWFSSIAYATHTTDYVGPGQIGWFTYNLKAPANAAGGTYRFDGDLVVAATGQPLNREGYFQTATVLSTNAASITISPSTVTMNVNATQQFTATVKDASGNVITNAFVGWTATGGAVSPTGLYIAGSSAGSFTVKVQSGVISATASVLVVQPGVVTASITQTGTYTIVVTFSNTLQDSTVINTNFKWDSATFPTTPTIQSGGTTNVAKRVRLDFNSSNLPGSGQHVLDIFDIKDVDGKTISPNPTSFLVTIPNDVTRPQMVSVTAVDSKTLDATFSESMKTTANFSSTTNAIDTTSNYRLVNRDGSTATTGGASGSGTTITISSVTVGGTSTLDEVFFERRARLTLSTDLRGATLYYLLATSVADEAGNIIDPNPSSVSFTFTPDTTRPTLVSTVATQFDLTVTFSKVMKHNATAGAAATTCAGSGVQIDNRSDYTSISTVDNTTTKLGNAISGATKCFISSDERTVIFTFDPNASTTPLPAGTYPLKISTVQDNFANVIYTDPTDTTVTVTDITAPTLTSAANLGSSSFSVTFGEAVRGGSIEPSSAGNPQNYSISGGAFGALCSTGSPSITTSDQKTWTISCSGTGVWPSSGTRSVTVRNVADFSGNVMAQTTVNF